MDVLIKNSGDSYKNLILMLEPMLLIVSGLAFWHPTPGRNDWLWLFGVHALILLVRVWRHGRIITRSPLDIVLVVFLIGAVVNVYAAPYTRGLTMLARPLYGILVYYAILESARTQRHMNHLVTLAVTLGLLVGGLALGSSQWTEKSDQMGFIIMNLPTISGFPGVGGGFNVNEIAGALAWLAPVLAGIAVMQWQQGRNRFAVSLAFGIVLLALFLGQSRMALIGVFLALGVIIYLLIRHRTWRWVAFAGLGLLVVLEVLIIANVFNVQNREALSTRDQNSFMGRIPMWEAAIDAITDYPLTGVGLSMFRDGRVREAYPVPKYETRVLPHTHNEFLQIGTDMGVPGLLIFIALHGALAYATWFIWRYGDAAARAIGIGAGAAILAHVIFGLADAITLWDRFAFLFWVITGLLIAQYTLVKMATVTTAE